MEEIQVKSTSGSISTNFDVIKSQLEDYLKDYEDYQVTEATLKIDKDTLADIRKVRKEINDRKIEVKKAFNEPYVAFENSCKELLKLVDNVIAPIDEQIKTFESKQVEEKRLHFLELYSEKIADYASFIPFENCLEEKWQNKSYSDKDFLYFLSERMTRIRSDLDVIKSLNSEIESEVIEVYQKSGNNLATAISRNTQFVTDKARVEEKVKSEIKTENLVEKTLEPVKTTRMVHFIVAGEDAEAVRHLLMNAGIIFGEEKN